jgi:hypothetical protein
VSPIQMGDHFLLRELAHHVLPAMICASRLRRQWFVRLAAIWGYGGDLVAALAALGIGAPIVAIMLGKAPNGKTAFETVRDSLPGPWAYVGVALLIAWAALRLIMQRQDVVIRAQHARMCAKKMKHLRNDLSKVLLHNNPMQEIAHIRKSVWDHVNEAIAEDIWPWDILVPPDEISAELNATVDEIRVRFMHRWAADLRLSSLPTMDPLLP